MCFKTNFEILLACAIISIFMNDIDDDSVDSQPTDIPVIDSQANDENIHNYDVDDRTLGNSVDNDFEDTGEWERDMFLVEMPMTPAGDNIKQVTLPKPKVYDRLTRIGVSTSYTVGLSTINQLGKRYPDLLINAMKEGKYIRLVGDNVNFSVGGDQLTRERLTQAMLLRYGNINPNGEFRNIGRCVAEFFHLGMNFLEKVIFGEMWNKSGIIEAGTLRGECERISRKGVDANVMNAYEEDKKFVTSYVTSNLVVAVMHFFGMETENDNPSRNCPSAQSKESSHDLMGIFVDKYIFPIWSGESNQCTDLQEVDCDDQNDIGPCQVVKVTLANGIELDIPMTTPTLSKNKENKPDKIKDYAHYSLEVGMTFIFYFLQNVKIPDRQKMLHYYK
ncbi:unnamed protein product [Mytilus coruscus]|uniref:DUF6589 domain-containing protein n=1 Tax=Mytilus coruscus TaxID=42192 RepID=A0A6J8DHL9_MYTCO|nr:unnamed protein product [Mytilus coruscus]